MPNTERSFLKLSANLLMFLKNESGYYMTMIVRNYIIRFGFLLTIMQLSLAVYLFILGIGDGQFYDKMFFYSFFLSLIPIIFGVIIFSFPDSSNTFIDHSNGFVNKNSLKKTKANQINDTPIYLIALGLVFLLYNLIFRLFALPNWVIIIIPFSLAILIYLSRQKNEILGNS